MRDEFVGSSNLVVDGGEGTLFFDTGLLGEAPVRMVNLLPHSSGQIVVFDEHDASARWAVMFKLAPRDPKAGDAPVRAKNSATFQQAPPASVARET